jgi:hypothetical protein
MTKNKIPTPILVIAILHLVFGIPGLLFGLCGAGMQAITQGNPQLFQPNPQQGAVQQEMNAYMDEHVPYHRASNYSLIGLNLLLSILMITGGIGLFYLKPWARTVSLVYAVLSLLEKLFSLIQTLVIWPTMQNFFNEQGQKNQAMAMASSFFGISMAVGLGVVFLSAIYPLVVLVILNRPSVKAAFQPQPDLPEEDFDNQWEEATRPHPPGDEDFPSSEAFTR